MSDEIRHRTLNALANCIITKHCDPSTLEEEVIIDIARRLEALEKKFLNE